MENNIFKRIKAIRKYILDYKSAQPISGDSWKLYRYTGTFSTTQGTRTFLVFTVNNPDIVATVKLIQPSDTLSLSTIGIRSQNGVYFWIIGSGYDTQSNVNYLLASTQPGNVAVTNTAPY